MDRLFHIPVWCECSPPTCPLVENSELSDIILLSTANNHKLIRKKNSFTLILNTDFGIILFYGYKHISVI